MVEVLVRDGIAGRLFKKEKARKRIARRKGNVRECVLVRSALTSYLRSNFR